MIELALPSGDLQTALIAFKNGADAVYFGMQSFSARKSAVNFSFQDLAVIRRYAKENGKKIYITVNTLISDENLDRVYSLLAKIDFYGCDGIICQDLGVAKLIKDHFPSLPLHGSTQLAVHTIEGVKVLQRYGFERVVLSRELTLEEIKAIRIACPDVELKVFIHGALCYGFSGLCMASYQSCGRSANGGACAQICRSYFNLENSDKNEHFFSMSDLNVGELIKELDKIGIDSAKIEGRMKSKEYVASITRYYRNILDGKDYSKDSDLLTTAFARTFSKGYYDYKKDRKPLVDTKYPSHRGLLCGKVIFHEGKTIEVESNKTLSLRDGICLFIPQEDGRELPFAFSLTQFKRNGNIYTIYLPEIKKNLLNLNMYKTSDSSAFEKEVKERLLPNQKGIDIKIEIQKDKLIVSYKNINTSIALKLEESKKIQDLKGNLEKIFRESGEGRYTLSSLTIQNTSGLQNPFLPLSFVKELRREFYKEVNLLPLEVKNMSKVANKESIKLPKRSLLSESIPWNTEGVEIDGNTYYTLPPITFNEEELFKEMEQKLKKTKNNIIALNNIAQKSFAHKHPEYKYFIDVYLFLTNRKAAQFYQELLGTSLIGGYLYPEYKDYQKPWPFTPTESNDYHLPIFISRSCFRHDSLKLSCKGCNEKSEWKINQQGKNYTVYVNKCLTVVI